MNNKFKYIFIFIFVIFVILLVFFMSKGRIYEGYKEGATDATSDGATKKGDVIDIDVTAILKKIENLQKKESEYINEINDIHSNALQKNTELKQFIDTIKNIKTNIKNEVKEKIKTVDIKELQERFNEVFDKQNEYADEIKKLFLEQQNILKGLNDSLATAEQSQIVI